MLKRGFQRIKLSNLCDDWFVNMFTKDKNKENLTIQDISYDPMFDSFVEITHQTMIDMANQKQTNENQFKAQFQRLEEICREFNRHNFDVR